MKNNKKGVSLVFVIVVVMALAIFSVMIFSAASRSLSMTSGSTDGRQTYLSAKSAIEYGKSVAYAKAKAGKMVPFSVGIGADGNYQSADIAGAAPELKGSADCLATCTGAGANTWKIVAKIKYNSIQKYQQLAYTFTLTPTSSGAPTGLPASDFFACGVQYGLTKVFENGYWPVMKNQTVSVYPVAENWPLYAVQGGGVTAPELLFMGDSDLVGWGVAPAGGHYSLIAEKGVMQMHSDRICIGSDVFMFYNSYYDGWLKREVCTDISTINLYPSTAGQTSGVIYFAGNNGGQCTVRRGTGQFQKIITIPKGFYRFQSGFDIGSIAAGAQGGYSDSQGRTMEKLEDTSGQKEFQQDIDYAQSYFAACQFRIVSGTDWSQAKGVDQVDENGIFAGGTGGNTQPDLYDSYRGYWRANNDGAGVYNLNESAVFTYATGVGWPSAVKWPSFTDMYGNNLQGGDSPSYYNIYCAKQLFLRYTSSADFTLPTYNVVFRSDTTMLNMMRSDSNEGSGADNRPKIVQASGSPSAEFRLTSSSLDRSGGYHSVTLIVPRDVKVVYKGGAKSYVIAKGVYSVPSGFNFFADHASDMKTMKASDYPVPGGSGSTADGFAITGGKYTDS